jgi:hypothetical protein
VEAASHTTSACTDLGEGEDVAQGLERRAGVIAAPFQGRVGGRRAEDEAREENPDVVEIQEEGLVKERK